MAKFGLLLSADFGIIFLKEFIHNGSLSTSPQTSHYETIITQAAAKVKPSLLIICRLKLLIPWSVGGWGY
jgi:hypothetical protein